MYEILSTRIFYDQDVYTSLDSIFTAESNSAKKSAKENPRFHLLMTDVTFPAIWGRHPRPCCSKALEEKLQQGLGHGLSWFQRYLKLLKRT